MLKVLHHLFLPHQHNNHKAKILWTRSLLILVGLFVMGRSIVDITIGLRPGILGYASQIDVGKIVEYTNQNRIKSGAEKVTLNAQLNAAAAAKVDDMFKENYWAHVSPKGTEPWTFISNAGYKYQHAGENLARDFSNSKDVVNAWMNSPSHKKNLLDKRYKDMGLAVKDGYLNGVETTIVVQIFAVAPTKSSVGKIAADSISTNEVLAQEEFKPTAEISPLSLSKVWSASFAVLILFALVMDWIFVLRYNLIRISGKTWAHLTFMWFVLLAIFVIRQGIIL
ncbi:hypothetical protein A2572_04650 [Candidatus Collierbacteria bacterium RIFOXYD1_FULL_40_9]|uniref:SCP domain-containing protein n=1 Tax=Candidatus Collierbacteria bacterium RIFOXYD1_FULL_40_9 TaxID=1817731 RepID=A0A1F5FUN0_9BACT|nr:MAG: hypothetical protein A2572_04650 [Candidatus Collierbacteria bacterium RIFOXYD1_FULL_40_9]